MTTIMMKTKAELLAELEELGVNKAGRKVRDDKGQPRGSYTRSSAPRRDKGKPRTNYSKTAAYHKASFASFIQANVNESGDLLTRDYNEIFPPYITKYYKLITTKAGKTYKASVKRNNHPEALRWRWWFTEWSEAYDPREKDIWQRRMCNWYFIKPEDLSVWTYNEWAWAYHNQINGHINRLTEDKIILSYDDYMNGKYGVPQYDKAGDIIWEVK